MQAPDEQDRVTCPDSHTGKPWKPEKVFEASGPNGKTQRQGVLGKHRHGFLGQELPWSGLLVPVTRIDTKDS